MTYEEILEIYNNPLNVAFKTLDNEIRYHYDLEDMILAQKVYDEVLTNEDRELIDEAISLYSVGSCYCESWLLDIDSGEQSVDCSDLVNDCTLMIGYYCDDKGFDKDEYYHNKYGFEVCYLPAFAKCDFDLQNAYKDTLKGISYITNYEKNHTLVYHTYSKNENCFTDFIAPATKVFESENICDYDELEKTVVSVAQKFGKVDVQPFSEIKEDEFIKGNADENEYENCYPRDFYNHSTYGKDKLEQLSSYYQYANKLANFSKNLYYDFALDTAGFDYMGYTLIRNNVNDFHNEHIYDYLNSLNSCESPTMQEFYIYVLSKDSFLKNHIKDWSSGTGKGAEQLRDKYGINYGIDLLKTSEKAESKEMSL